MAKKAKVSVEDKYFPVATIPSTDRPVRPAENPAVMKQIIQSTIRGAYKMKIPDEYDIKNGRAVVVPEGHVQFISHLIESLEPSNAIEAALASQFVITYVRGLQSSQKDHPNDLDAALRLFGFGHEVLETLQRYRTKGAQLISVQYSHTQQINNISVNKTENPQHIEV